MKRLSILWVILAVLISSVGCSQKSAPPKSPVNFYYPSVDFVYDGKTEIIQAEIRESAGYEDKIEDLLNLYFKGPESFTLRSPFPEHLTVSRYATTANSAVLLLSSEFSQLEGIDLSIAYACIANTLFDLTQLNRVQISILAEQPENLVSVIFDKDDIYFVDTPNSSLDTTETTVTP